MHADSVTANTSTIPRTIPRGLHWEIPRTELLRYLLIASAAVFPYLNTLGSGFVFDDNLQILQNPYIKTFRYVGRIFGSNVWSFLSSNTMTNYYRPLMSVQYLFTYQLFGKMAYPYHLLNVLMNCAVVSLLYALTRRLFGSTQLATIATVLFALHPAHTEVVAWVAAVPDLQMTMFILMAFWFFLDLGEPERKRWWTWPTLGICFICALLAKEPAIMFPAAATVYEHFYRERAAETPIRSKLTRYLPLWIICSTYLIWRTVVMGALARSIHVRPPWYQTTLTANTLTAHYLGKLVWPVNLSAFHELTAARTILDPGFLVGFACIAALIAIGWSLWKNAMKAGFGILWMMLFILPTLNSRWMVSVSYAERYLYLPSVGFCWLIAAGADWWIRANESNHRTWMLRLGWATAMALCILMATRIITRNRDWHDDVTFYQVSSEQHPTDGRLRTDLGTAYARIGRTDAAISEWNIAVQYNPKNFLALSNLGNAAVSRKHYADAVDYFDRAIAVTPTYPDAHYGLAQAYQRENRPVEAEAEYRLTLEIAPLDVDARNDYAKFCESQGRENDAAAQFREAFKVVPNSDALDGLGDIAIRRGDDSAATANFLDAEKLDDYDHHAHYQLAIIYARQGRLADASREFQSGYRTDIGTDPLEGVARNAVTQGSPKSN